MDDDRRKAARTLRRIAAALGTDVMEFSAFDDAPSSHQDVLELLSLFTSLQNPDDRRTCLDFVRSVAMRARDLPR